MDQRAKLSEQYNNFEHKSGLLDEVELTVTLNVEGLFFIYRCVRRVDFGGPEAHFRGPEAHFGGLGS